MPQLAVSFRVGEQPVAASDQSELEHREGQALVQDDLDRPRMPTTCSRERARATSPAGGDRSEDGVASALGVAESLGPQGPQLVALSSFSAGYSAALAVAAATLLLGAVVAAVGARRGTTARSTT